MEEMCANETVQTLPAECKHTFHKVCIQRWLTRVSHTSDPLHAAAIYIIITIIIIMFFTPFWPIIGLKQVNRTTGSYPQFTHIRLLLLPSLLAVPTIFYI